MNSIKPRLFTAFIYVVVIIGCILLKAFIPGGYGSLAFDLLFTAISVIGAFEFMRAVKEISTLQRAVVYAFCAVHIPAYVTIKMLADAGVFSLEYIGTVSTITSSSVCCFLLAALLVFDFPHTSVKGTGLAFFATLYCGVLPGFCSVINHLPNNSLFAIIILFFDTVAVDTFAFLVGLLLHKRFPKQLAPHVSPNKTVIGAVGGILGGVVGTLIAYYAFTLCGGVIHYNYNMPEVVMFIILSLPISIMSQLGDLFESAIKRGCDIKDMGKLLPGHGGVLDRFDSIIVGSIAVLLVFSVIIV